MLQPSGLDYPSAARPAARGLLRLKTSRSIQLWILMLDFGYVWPSLVGLDQNLTG
jgi:predicted small integral membrane protein